ncbi:hypothetical protein [Mesorhizobium sp.]|nr:hypothetical protein [Mesorhizobium sp.]
MTMKFYFTDTLRKKLEAGTGMTVDGLTCKRPAARRRRFGRSTG